MYDLREACVNSLDIQHDLQLFYVTIDCGDRLKRFPLL